MLAGKLSHEIVCSELIIAAVSLARHLGLASSRLNPFADPCWSCLSLSAHLVCSAALIGTIGNIITRNLLNKQTDTDALGCLRCRLRPERLQPERAKLRQPVGCRHELIPNHLLYSIQRPAAPISIARATERQRAVGQAEQLLIWPYTLASYIVLKRDRSR